MITRPLELAARLRPGPRPADFLFYVNVGALALFFLVFGSRFVLAPGLGVDFRMPRVAGAGAGAAPVKCYLSVKNSGQVFVNDGLLTMAQLDTWLRAQARGDARASLLIRASAGVPSATVGQIISLARAAGFAVVIWGAEEPAGPAMDR